jgi:hypothetical protein
MMDWSTHDYAKTFADTIYTPEQDCDEGVYILDEAGRDTDCSLDTRIRVPIRPYGDPAGRFGRAARHSEVGTPFNEYRAREGSCGNSAREGFYGNIISARENNGAVFDVAWDERPMHYNPNAGKDWAHLVPPPYLRPPGGGPAPTCAFPPITNSEAQVGPKNLFQGGGGDAGASAGACRSCDRTAALVLQFMKVILVIILVLLAMALMSVGHLARRLEKTVKAAVKALGEAAGRR